MGIGRGIVGKSSNLQTMHILACTKNAALADAASMAFEAHGPRLTLCESTLEVLGVVGVVEADLLILDMQTPGLNGLLLISAIQELAPNLPILAVSKDPVEDARAFGYKGVSYAMLPSDSQWDGRALATTLAEIGGRGRISSSAGSR